jgi:hypothetical protein
MARHRVHMDMASAGEGRDYRWEYHPRCRDCPWEGSYREPLDFAASQGIAHEDATATN